ncbi:hypothetical protein FQN55_005535 [Onygenales sp. PD_40]|nr:hypothetical protein FQN55_005535 [Onygenales sp. PD_40]
MRSSFTPSSGDLSAMTTPMSSRHVSYNAPYNPQEWGPITGSGSPNMGLGASNGIAPPCFMIEGAPIPPPPYSPRYPKPEGTGAESSPHLPVAVAPAPLGAPSPYNTSAPRQHRDSTSSYRYSSRPRPVSMIQGGDISHNPFSVPSNGNNHAPHSSGASGFPIGSNVPSFNGGRTSVSSMSSSSRLSPDNMDNDGNDLARPPASKRAASTGDIASRGSQNGASSYAWLPHKPGRWEPGMPLPPPPPGPPPNGLSHESRDSSLAPSQDGSNRSSRHRSPPMLGTTLGEVPPTPAGWIDETIAASRLTADSSIDRANSTSKISNPDSYTAGDELAHFVEQSRNPPPSILRRDDPPSTRAMSAKGIRERRIESRRELPIGTSTHEKPDNAWPADLVLGNPGGPGLSRRRTFTKNTPRTPRTAQSEPQASGTVAKSPFTLLTSTSSTQSTPKPPPSPSPDNLNQDPNSVQTPPFSPGASLKSPGFPATTAPHIPSKTLPTPPLAGSQGPRRSSSLTPGSARQNRQSSPALPLPIDGADGNRSQLLVSGRLQTRPSRPNLSAEQDSDEFIRDAVQRHREFIERETAAPTEAEALELFSEFIVSESNMRRQRYAAACDTGLFDVQPVRDKLFNPEASPSNGTRTLAVSSARIAPQIGGLSDVPQPRAESGWWNNYKPSLSPIGSMSVSNNDEMSSRGRAPSRWWESQTGSESGGSGKKVRRSKQESKYMGVPREVREAMQLEHFSAGMVDNNQSQGYPPAVNYSMYGPNEYPPEKTGLDRQPSLPRAQMGTSPAVPKLDISRFVTLPPPYPRHYPAVNNNHPDLLYYRTTVRSMSDLSEVQETKRSHKAKLETLQQDYQIKMKEARRALRSTMNTRIEEGTLSYAEAAEAEKIHLAEEQKREKELVQAEFDSYQEAVFQPLQIILKDRIDIASTCIDNLRSKLFDSTQNGTPNQTQEEGDEQPELLEKLTQLKWLFEALEQLHREVYELQSERNERYRAIVTLPYRQAKNQEKLLETDSFFIQDAQDRKLAFATETRRRFESFMDVIERNVGRGVEIQLSAFWDIAPSLVTILQKIPVDLRTFSVHIPSKEYAENPSYYQYPLQYLYSLLSHAEKSTFQFIESQTNLLCLLHEVKTSLMKANCNVMEVQRIGSGEPEDSVKEEMKESRDEEERRLTADLKDKVAMVEEQWTEALGKELTGVKARVQQWLVSQGGWDEMLLMEQS